MDELLGYLVGFWRFVLNKQFRIDCIAAYKRMKPARKILEIVGAMTSVFIGVGVPILLVLQIVDNRF